MQLIASYYSHQLWTSVWNRLMKLLIIPPLLCSHLNGLIKQTLIWVGDFRKHWGNMNWWAPGQLYSCDFTQWLQIMMFTKVCSLFPLLFVMALLLKYIFSIKKKKEKITWQWKVLRAISFPGQRDCYCVSGIFAREGRPHVEWGSEQPLWSYMYMLLSFCNLGEELTRIKKSHRS